MAVSTQLPTRELLLVQRSAHSEELAAAVGQQNALAVQQAVASAEAALSAPQADLAQWHRSKAEALYGVARQCLSLAAAVRKDFDDGTLAAGSQAPLSEDEASDCGWPFGVAVAEAIAQGLAAMSMGLDASSLDLLEHLSVDLDQFAPSIFGGLCALDAQDRLLTRHEERLLQALQGVCAWTLSSVARAIGYERFSAAVLWEWSSNDMLWALILGKGVLALSPAMRELDTVPIPADLFTLQKVVLLSVFGLASPSIAFPADVDGDGVSIEIRNAELVCHRAELAVAVVNCRMTQVLIGASALLGFEVAPSLTSFFVALLQPEIVDDPAWESQSPLLKETVKQARRAQRLFCDRLVRYGGILWHVLREVPSSMADGISLGFLQDAAMLAYFCPPPAEAVQFFIATALNSRTANGPAAPDPAVLAPLCILAANALMPSEGSSLFAALAQLSAEGREAVVARWERWRGPVQLAGLAEWVAVMAAAEVLEARARAQVAPAPAMQLVDPSPPPVPRRAGIMQNLVHEAPAEFRCQLDGQLMMDPVRTPYGHTCERSGLVHALGRSGGNCPLTGQPMAIEACQRDAALRKRALQWVRARPASDRQTRPQLAAAAARAS